MRAYVIVVMLFVATAALTSCAGSDDGAGDTGAEGLDTLAEVAAEAPIGIGLFCFTVWA